MDLYFSRTRDRSVARYGSGVVLAGQVVGQEAAAARQAAVTVGNVTVTASATLHCLLRQQQTFVFTIRRVLASST